MRANFLNIWGSLQARVQIYEAERTGSSAPLPAFKHIRLEGLKYFEYLGQFQGMQANILNIWGSLQACVQIYEAGRTGSSAPSPAFSEGSTRDWLSVR